MSKTTIYYFSATGNSLAVARHLAKLLDSDEPVSVPGSLINQDPYIDTRGTRKLGFVFPVQRATIPEMLRGFIQSMPIDPTCYYFAVSTYSLFGSNEFWDIDELLVAEGAALNFATGVRMMGNVGLVNPSESTITKRLAHMERQVEEIATAVAYRQENFFPRANRLLGWAIRTYTDFRRKHIFFTIDKRCKGCGICVQVCPAQNIQLSRKDSSTVAPIRSDKCEACLACVHWCPAAAVSASGRVHTSYHNPLVQPEELQVKSPKASAGAMTGDAVLPTGSAAETSLDEGLASIPHHELLEATDLNTRREAYERDRTPRHPKEGEYPKGQREPGMSDAEIVKALSELER